MTVLLSSDMFEEFMKVSSANLKGIKVDLKLLKISFLPNARQRSYGVNFVFIWRDSLFLYLGCNNPNLPGGGKLLPYLDIAMSSKTSSKLYTPMSSKTSSKLYTTYSAKSSSSGGSGKTQGYNIITTGKGKGLFLSL